MKKYKLNFFLDLFGVKTKKSFASVMTYILDDYVNAGLLRAEEKKMFKNILSFGDKKVSSIMTPRSDIVAVERNTTLKKLKEIITVDGNTRIPIFKNDFDNIVGFIHSKDLAKFLCSSDEDFSPARIMRKILFVPGSMKLLEVLFRMRMSRVHIAIVLDQFGGVDGLVTIENLMEEIIGDIEDEHDLPSDSSFFRIRKVDENKFHFGGRVEIEKLEEVLRHKFRSGHDSFETVGGFVMALFNQVPEIDQEIEQDDMKIKVLDADEKSVKLVEVAIAKS